MICRKVNAAWKWGWQLFRMRWESPFLTGDYCKDMLLSQMNTEQKLINNRFVVHKLESIVYWTYTLHARQGSSSDVVCGLVTGFSGKSMIYLKCFDWARKPSYRQEGVLIWTGNRHTVTIGPTRCTSLLVNGYHYIYLTQVRTTINN